MIVSSPPQCGQRCMNSNGVMTKCLVPSRHGVVSFNATCPVALGSTRSSDSAGRVMMRHTGVTNSG